MEWDVLATPAEEKQKINLPTQLLFLASRRKKRFQFQSYVTTTGVA